MASLVTGNKNAGKKVRGDDFNETPYAALPPLLAAEGKRLPKVLWEPYCGNGALVVPLRNRGYAVTATDLRNRGCPASAPGVDFLSHVAAEYRPAGQFGIVSNPPYTAVEQHIERAVGLAPYVAFLLRLAFLESEGRMHWWREVGLRRVHLISERLPMMHRENYDGPKQDKGAMAFAWFIFANAGVGARTFQVPVRWVSYKAACRRFPMQEADRPPTASAEAPSLLAWGQE